MNARYLASRTNLAWRLARYGAAQFGGHASEYFGESMREVWADYNGVLAYLNGERPSALALPASLLALVTAALVAIGCMFPGNDFAVVFFGMIAQMAVVLPFIARMVHFDNRESNNEYVSDR